MSRQNPTVIIALGGNAISPKNESGDIAKQFAHTKESLDAMMYFVDNRYNICITHGNGPQVGAELLKNEITKDKIPSLPLGVLVANTQGAIGYMIQQTLQNALQKNDIDREVVTFISQVIVDKNDPTIQDPTKFIGKVYDEQKAKQLSKEYEWNIKEQEKGIWRRVVASPKPLYIFNGNSVKHLVDFGTIVIAGGGGGIPAFEDKNNLLHGLDAVIDKDISAALLGRVIKAEELFIITDVDQVCLNYGTNNQIKISKTNIKELQAWINDNQFGEGTMLPKIHAAIYFLEHHGQKVVITSLNKLEEAIKGNAGTIITKEN
ncbi:MAG: carbamate kinase [Gammaproteobacteria bacterium]|nr:carbamate kinase [Gammaproteobacteria bacterium]